MTKKEQTISNLKKLKSFHNGSYGVDIDRAIKSLEQEPKTGHWIETGDYFTGAYGDLGYYKCSCCHEDSLEDGDFCPNCGAKMVEPQESEEV